MRWRAGCCRRWAGSRVPRSGWPGSDLHRRIELGGPDDELKELADTFDEMLDRLDRAFESQRRFVANASHELRTPLAINRTLLEVQLADPEASPELQQLGKTLLATNERSEQLVEGLLLLARSENKVVDKRPVDLAEVAAQAVDQSRAEAHGKGVEFRGVRGQVFVQGNGVLLERIALNLVQNAVRYNVPEDGWVEVSTEPQPGCAVLVVANTGPVVPAYEVEQPLRAVPAAAHRAHRQRQGRRPRPVDRALRRARARRHDHRPAPRGRRTRHAGRPAALTQATGLLYARWRRLCAARGQSSDICAYDRPSARPYAASPAGLTRRGVGVDPSPSSLCAELTGPPAGLCVCDRSQARFSSHLRSVIENHVGMPGKSGFPGGGITGSTGGGLREVRHSDRVRS